MREIIIVNHREYYYYYYLFIDPGQGRPRLHEAQDSSRPMKTKLIVFKGYRNSSWGL